MNSSAYMLSISTDSGNIWNKYSRKLHVIIYIQENIRAPSTLTVPISAHKMALTTPITEMYNNPLLVVPVLLIVSAPLPAETFVFLRFTLTRLKLDIRSKARFTKAFSAADAGVVGIDSTNAHSAEENRLAAPPSS